MWSVAVIVFGLGAVTGINLSDADHYRLPRLFHMDDYGRCLARPRALYCMGSLRMTPATTPHRMYEVIKEYSSSKFTFDRTLLHRGYCVSSRCAGASQNATLADKAQRFESCVQKWARPLGLEVRLETLAYCRSPEDRLLETKAAQHDDSYHQLLLKLVSSVLLLNLVGTLYDVLLTDDVKKNKMLVAWSVRSNWRRLLASYEDGDERLIALAPIQGVRVALLTIVVLAHAGNIHYMLYTYNPQFLEYMTGHPLMMVVKNGAAIVQVFVMLSSFLLAYNLLAFSKQKLTLALLPKIIVNRVSRLLPVYALVLLFSMSWMPLVRDGPVWQLVVGGESQVCRRKFWAHMLFINNYVEPESHCLLQTWFLAVDMQLHVLAALVTLAMAQFNMQPLRLLPALFVGACALNSLLAYVFDWKSLMYITVPDNMRTLFRDAPSFSGVYTSAWGSLPACLAGLYLAHRLHGDQQQGKKFEPSWLFLTVYRFSIPLLFCWIMAGNLVDSGSWRLLTAALVGIERPGFTLISAVMLYGFCHKIDSSVRSMFSWHGFRVMARMSLSVLLLHWSLDMLVAAARPTLLHTSLFDMISDGISTWAYTYVLAIPFTILLEMPCYRFVSALS